MHLDLFLFSGKGVDPGYRTPPDGGEVKTMGFQPVIVGGKGDHPLPILSDLGDDPRTLPRSFGYRKRSGDNPFQEGDQLGLIRHQ